MLVRHARSDTRARRRAVVVESARTVRHDPTTTDLEAARRHPRSSCLAREDQISEVLLHALKTHGLSTRSVARNIHRGNSCTEQLDEPQDSVEDLQHR